MSHSDESTRGRYDGGSGVAGDEEEEAKVGGVECEVSG